MYIAKICVVDDCIDEATILSEGLRLFGYDTCVAYCGLEAINLCQKETVHLLLLDIGLPDIDGYEVCRRLKNDPRTTNIPVIFVTARGSADEVALGYDIGAVDYVAKPYNLPIVVIHIEAALRTRQIHSDMVSGPYILTDPIYTDRLTGLRNRPFLIKRLQEESEKACRYNYPLSCLLLDFEEGSLDALCDEETSVDDLLIDAALALKNSSRSCDILARFDETQFAAVLPHIQLPNAVTYANKICREISHVLGDGREENPADLYVGVVTCKDVKRVPSAEDILGEAMRSLLLAKSGITDRIHARIFASS